MQCVGQRIMAGRRMQAGRLEKRRPESTLHRHPIKLASTLSIHIATSHLQCKQCAATNEDTK